MRGESGEETAERIPELQSLKRSFLPSRLATAAAVHLCVSFRFP